ncbi:metal ABC transporter permease [Mycobacterium yunnanensis]|uniref:Metal ABC transporter permease n=1 Tax=Mycobacterium yunnanensis TaxID=368477 RepID=A0A9X2Z875_9MYCO|nr:metal ABC transporter permease [Mycobacterium yunnanensis]MCV7423900.1 metal ABC transporter permease [Mycobacterium yunnanensis]
MQNALIGGTVVALASGLMGYFIVVRRNAFACHALAHIGLPGATGAVLLGVPPVLGLGAFCVGGALVIGAMGKRMADRDVVTGTVLAFATGLGLFFSSLATKSSSTMTNVLFGNLLAITGDQLVGFTVLFAILTLCVGLVFRPLLYGSVNAPVAEAKGVPVRALSVVFMVLLALAVTMAVQAVGTLLLSALLITPAATGIMLTPRPSRAMAIAAAISVISVWVGLGASAMFNVPPSFLVVTVACGIWLTVWSVDRSRQSRSPAPTIPVGQAMTAPTRCPTR